MQTPDTFACKTTIEQAVHKFNTDNSRELDEDGKVSCTLCTKKFRAMEFIIKHHALKHAEDLEKIKKHILEEQYRRNWQIDPNHIGPRIDASGSLMAAAAQQSQS
jgi:hypothetical protein